MMVYLSPMLEYPVPLPKKYQICIENGNFHLEFEYSRGGEGRRRRELSRHLQFAALIILVSSLLLLAAGSLMWRLLQSQKEGRMRQYNVYMHGGKSFHSMDGYKYNVFFRQIKSFIRFHLAFVLGLQTLQLINFTKIYQIISLEPKNKG